MYHHFAFLTLFRCRSSFAVLCRSAPNILLRKLIPCYTESDFTFPTEFRRRAEDILIETKAKYQIQLFSDVEHGFAVRGDLANPDGRSYPRSSLSR
jgi:hypothetical protein